MKLTLISAEKNWGRGKAPSGEKALYEGNLLAVGMSAISAITVNGPLLCHIHVKGTITAERFMDFFKELLTKCGDQVCCFFLDNATIHRKEDIVAAAEERNQAVLFNAPLSNFWVLIGCGKFVCFIKHRLKCEEKFCITSDAKMFTQICADFWKNILVFSDS